MSNETYEQQQILFTEEEVVAKVTESVNNAYSDVDLRVQRAKDNLDAWHAKAVLEALREARDNELIDNEVGVELYNAIAEKLGWETVETLQRLFTVAVNYKGYTVAEFSDVEADNDREAGEKVLEDMDIEASISVTVSYKGDSGEATIDIDSWDLDTDEFDTDVEAQ